MYVRMSVEQWWNDTDRGKAKYWEKNQWQLHFIYLKYHSGTKPGPQQSEAGDSAEPCMAFKGWG